MANEIEHRYALLGVHCLSLNHGVILTNLGRHIDEQAKSRFETIAKLQKLPEQGANTTVWATVFPQCEGKGGWCMRFSLLSSCD